MAHINVELASEDVVEAMNDDGLFCKDLLTAIAQGVYEGLLLDNMGDLFSDMSERDRTHIRENFRKIVSLLEPEAAGDYSARERGVMDTSSDLTQDERDRGVMK